MSEEIVDFQDSNFGTLKQGLLTFKQELVTNSKKAIKNHENKIYIYLMSDEVEDKMRRASKEGLISVTVIPNFSIGFVELNAANNVIDKLNSIPNSIVYKIYEYYPSGNQLSGHPIRGFTITW